MKNFLKVLLALGSLILSSCTKDVPAEPPLAASITTKDTTINFLNPISQIFQDTYAGSSGPISIGRFHYEQYASQGNESLDVQYEEKPTRSASYPIPSAYGPILGFIDKNGNTWNNSSYCYWINCNKQVYKCYILLQFYSSLSHYRKWTHNY